MSSKKKNLTYPSSLFAILLQFKHIYNAIEYFNITEVYAYNANFDYTTLNNTVIASPRSLIAIIENNYMSDGSIKIPKALQPYMGGVEIIKPSEK